MTTRTFTEDELDELDVPYTCLSDTEIEKHRWYTSRAIVFEHEGRFWQVTYLDPATESQDGQERWIDPDAIEATEVFRTRKSIEAWTTQAPTADPGVGWLFDLVLNNTADMDDGDDPPFGMYPKTEYTYGSNTMIVRPDQDPDHWDGEADHDEETPGVVPAGPVIRITVERIG